LQTLTGVAYCAKQAAFTNSVTPDSKITSPAVRLELQ
jgi:hypothetical protein